jgi:hypothetical protein
MRPRLNTANFVSLHVGPEAASHSREQIREPSSGPKPVSANESILEVRSVAEGSNIGPNVVTLARPA